jgi:hypothetical protein
MVILSVYAILLTQTYKVRYVNFVSHYFTNGIGFLPVTFLPILYSCVSVLYELRVVVVYTQRTESHTWLTEIRSVVLDVISRTYLLTYLLTYSMVQNIIWKADCHSAYQKKSFFMEPEGSSPCSQKPVTGPCPEPAESSLPHLSLSP